MNIKLIRKRVNFKIMKTFIYMYSHDEDMFSIKGNITIVNIALKISTFIY